MTEETEQPVEQSLDELLHLDRTGLYTAEGVGPLLEATRAFIEDRSYARPAMVLDAHGGVIPTILTPDGGYRMLTPTELDAFADNPRFRRGTATMTSLGSFIDLLNRFGDEDSAVFARDTRDNPGLLAVLDYNRRDTLGSDEEPANKHGEYRHGKHRIKFDFPVSDEWKAWTAKNGQVMSMLDFAAFLEDNVLDVAEIGDAVPESAERFVEMCGGERNIADWSQLTALAKSLSVFESATVTEITDLHGGAVNLNITEGHDTEIAGIKATVPTMFFIAIPIFREGAYYRLPIRLRYRKQRGSVVFFYEMWREDRAFMDAVRDAVNKVAAETTAQTFYGTPEG
jgi:hypothetical protein